MKLWHRNKDKSPAEIDEMIRAHASEASRLLYQEAIAQHVVGRVADIIDNYRSEYARGVEETNLSDVKVVDTLDEVAHMLRKSIFPAEPVYLRKVSRYR